MDDEVIKKLDRCLSSGKSILFTGAGFSSGAHNGYGEPIPLGDGLKAKILKDLLNYKETDEDFIELKQEPLSSVCTFAEENCATGKFNDFIRDIFVECKPEPFHIAIANCGLWKRIYTINIDDLLEKSANPNTLSVQDMANQNFYNKPKPVEYIKLHGNASNKASTLVFSNQQYVDSMLKSTDYRFNLFAQDMQMKDFVILGTEMAEMNLDYYMNLFSTGSWKTTHGQLFFINPKPKLAFESRVKRIGGHIIKWSSEQFAEHIKSIEMGEDYAKEIEGYLSVRSKFDLEKKFKGYKSRLYYGRTPDYRDIIFDWDFLHPDIMSLQEDLLSYFKDGNGKKLMISLYGKTLVGKSVYLKRIGISLMLDGFLVFEKTGLSFNILDFLSKIRPLSDRNIALLIENASFNYPEIKRLINAFPMDKNIVVLTTAKTIFHHKKRYSLVSEPWYKEISVTGETKTDNREFALNIEHHLDEKGLLGKIKAYSLEERLKYIEKYNDVESLLFSITNGRYFQNRQISSFYDSIKDDSFRKYLKLLQQLSIFYKLNLPYMPLEVVSLIYGPEYSAALDACENYLTLHADINGITLRDPFMVDHILKKLNRKGKISLIKDILVAISPQVNDDNHCYWNEMASTLMKGKMLRSMLKMSKGDVKNLLTDIKNYYNEDYNYWLQVGISEQQDSEYDLALNHFRQAESMSPNSYIVRNAIARNYLRQANVDSDFEIAQQNHLEGTKLMNKLIDDCEEFQVKAYSTHCLLFETVRFYRHYKISPSKEKLQSMYEQLKMVIDKDPDGPMSKHISNVFFKFVQDTNLNKYIPKMSFYDLQYLRNLVEVDVDIKEDIIEDFELD